MPAKMKVGTKDKDKLSTQFAEIHEKKLSDIVVDMVNQDKTDVNMTDDERVELINNLYQEGIEGSKIKIGSLILQAYFEEDTKQALSRNPNKDKSFSDFSKRSDLKVTSSTLIRWVQAASVTKECASEKIKITELSFSQLAALAKMTDKKARLELAKKAVSSRMTVKDIIEEVKSSKKTTGSIGKSTLSKDNLDLGSIKKYLSNPEEAMADADFMEMLQDSDFISSNFNRKERLDIYEAVEKATESKQEQLERIAQQEQKIHEAKEPVEKTVQNLRGLLNILEGFVLEKSA